MKKLLILSAFGLFLAAASGCHICDCWRYAYGSNSNAKCAQTCSTPCVVVDDESCASSESCGCR